MYVLGIKPSLGLADVFRIWGVHDGGAALLRDGEIVAAVQEERFTRKKRAKNTFPSESVKYVLRAESIDLSDIDTVAIGRNPKLRLKRTRKRISERPTSVVPSNSKQALDTLDGLKATVAAYNGVHRHRVKQKLAELNCGQFDGRMETVSHHRSHAASAYHCSPFDTQLTVTIDAQGEHDSTVLWDENLDRVQTFSSDNSLGFLYSYGTQYLGYRHGGDAGKVMGLASYGEHRPGFARAFDSLVSVGSGEYDVTAVTAADDPISVFEDTFGPRRIHPEEFTQRHKDFAFHLQKTTESIVCELVEHHIKREGIRNVALAGGVAMNCKLNREILALDCVDDLFIQPAADDSGICLGAALDAYRSVTGEPPKPAFTDVYLGPEYSNEAIQKRLDSAKVEYERADDIAAEAARLLAEGYLVGWFQGRMEFGARALGNRSILADPTAADSLDRVNRNVKHREPWRPFAPSLLYEAKDEYLEGGEESPFMILLDSVHEDRHDEISAVTHVDGTTRPQTVREDINPKYYRLIETFGELTGTPVVLNTSFNVAGEPIVESPEQAIQDFFSTGLDALAIGDYLLQKPSVDT